MIAYKLLRKRKNGTLGPLFINRKQVIPIGEELKAEPHYRKGFKFRPGWHATLVPVAPHLSKKGRVWARVEVEGVTHFKRPESQGGCWVLAEKMTVREVLQ